MKIPQPSYVEDQNEQKTLVQFSLKEWENFVRELEQMKNQLTMKNKLERAFREVREIKKGKKQGTSLKDFLDEIFLAILLS